MGIASGYVPRLVDTHYHLDHAADPDRVIADLEREHIFCIAVTLRPGDFPLTQVLTKGCRYIRPALGYHPVHVTSGAEPLEEFREYLNETRYIGEIGLDYTRDTLAPPDVQRRVFSALVDACAAAPSRVLSVHSRRAAADVVAAVEGFPGTTILHWFSGPLSVLERAAASGCYFSVNLAMTRSAKGREVVAHIPNSRLLTETDGPFVQSYGREAEPPDVFEVIRMIASIRGEDERAVRSSIYRNFSTLIARGAGDWPTSAGIGGE